MIQSPRASRKGASILEFTLVGIALIFVLISFFEMARGMWTYQTLAYAVREGARYASVHGRDCDTPTPPNCRVTVAQIVSAIRSAGPGLDPNATTVTLTDANGAVVGPQSMTAFLSSTTLWPSTAAYTPGQVLQISASYPFRTILAMFWVGDGRPLSDSQTFHLAASSTEFIQY